VESLRELILPKLREERDRERKGKKVKSVKDTVIGNDFEVGVFLTEGGTRHAVMSKQRIFKQDGKARLKSNSSKLGLASPSDEVSILKDEDLEEQPIDLDAIPLASDTIGEEEDLSNLDTLRTPEQASVSTLRTKSKKKGSHKGNAIKLEETEDIAGNVESPDATFTAQQKGKLQENLPRGQRMTRSNKRNPITIDEPDPDAEDLEFLNPIKEEKKGYITTYDGFTIYGKVLYLVVKRLHNDINATSARDTTTSLGAKNVINTHSNEGIMGEWMQMSQAVTREEYD